MAASADAGSDAPPGPLALPEPPDACAPVDASLAGKVALVNLGAYTFVDMVLHAQRSGAVAVVSYAPSFPAPVVMVHSAPPSATAGQNSAGTRAMGVLGGEP